MWSFARTTIAFAVSLGILIFIHEFGHFLAAKIFGIKVERFSLGFGPRLLGKKVGDTDYRISAFPLGGYVKLLGESAEDEIPEAMRPASFSHQPLRRRMSVVAAGPVSNLLLAVFLYALIFALFGLARPTTDIGSVTPDSPAAAAGLQADDRVLAVDGVPVQEWDELSEFIQRSGGKATRIRVQRGDEVFTVEITPEIRQTRTFLGELVNRPLIGIVASSNVRVEKVNPFMAVYYGIAQTGKMIELTFVVLGKLIMGAISPKTLAGPIGIAQMSGQVAKAGPLAFLSFLALLSINLGILNLLPIPVLDGGHLLFFSIEAIMGKPLSMKKRETAQQVGLFLLIVLMVFVFYNDIYRLVYPGKPMP
ncbi:MAG: RIP metalloprotease RseP [Deltaproteobacteria bacterium]|nr:MAG: RIP metalloprotease RseP [Deltaproteobacteria bacterium]